MKIFKDLEFKPRPFNDGVGATMKFDNGFTISVQAGSSAYSTPRENLNSPDDFTSFEIAVLDPDDGWTTKQFIPDHDDNVLGWQDRGQINALMLLIQSKK